MIDRIRSLARRLRTIGRRRQLEQDLHEEVAFHLAMREAKLRGDGSPDPRRHARRRFGNSTRIDEDLRRAWAVAPVLQDFWRDARYATRTLIRTPAYTWTAVLTLALAIGANTAMFGVLHATILSPLPYPSPDRLVNLWSERPGDGTVQSRTAFLNLDAWRSQNTTLDGIAFFDPTSAAVTSDAGAEQITIIRGSANMFDLFGVSLEQGRSFTAEEAESRLPVAVVSHRFWQTRLAGRADVIGSSIQIDGHRSTIVGVAPPGVPALGSDVWEPYTMFADWDQRRLARGTGAWFVRARLKPGVSIERARTDLNAIAARVDGPGLAPQQRLSVSVQSFARSLTSERTRLALWLLTGAVFCVLLVAATNVASLSLARAVGRGREIAVRAALGAGRWRIVRQLLVESLVLATLAGMAALAVADLALRVILVLAPGDLANVRLDLATMASAAAFALVTALLAGLAPALRSVRAKVELSATEGSRTVAGDTGARRARRLLVSAELALAIVLLVAAGLLVRSLMSAERVDPGFDASHVLVLAVATRESSSDSERVNLYARLLEQVVAAPGVEHAALISDFAIGGGAETLVWADGAPAPVLLTLRRDEMTPGLLAVVGAALRRGRDFANEDGPTSPRVTIVNETMARRLWPGTDPIGRRFKLGPVEGPAPWFTVVGVTADMRRQGPEVDPIPQMFESMNQSTSRLLQLLVRTTGDDPLLMAETVKRAVRLVDATLPIYGTGTLDLRFEEFLKARRFQTSLLVAFSVVTLVIAAIGIYGLVHYSVATRTPEIAIRMAVGAESGEIFRMVIREGVVTSLSGLIVGLVGAIAVGVVGSSLLFGVTATDPVTFVSVSALLLTVVVVACIVPARRATKVNPIAALRQS